MPLYHTDFPMRMNFPFLSFQIGVASFFPFLFHPYWHKHMYTFYIYWKCGLATVDAQKPYSVPPKAYTIKVGCVRSRSLLNACFRYTFGSCAKKGYSCVCMGVFYAYALSFVCSGHITQHPE